MPQYQDKERKTWYASFYCNGKKHTKRGFKTKKEAKKYEDSYKAIKEGTTNITFGALWDEYIKECETVYKLSTLIQKQHYYDRYIMNALEDIKVIDITPLLVKNLTDSMLEDNRSTKTCNNIISQINACITWGRDYYDFKTVPRFKKFKTTVAKRNVWEPEHLNIFLSRIDNYEYYVAFNILFWLGIREGELLALTIGDINLPEIQITKTYNYIHNITTTPKTNNSVRIVVAPKFICEMIEKLIKMKYKPSSDDRLFSFNNPKNLHYYVKRYAYGLPDIAIHDLRHSHATYLIKNGVDITSVSSRLGHSDPSITLKVYAHNYKDSDNHVADYLDHLQKNKSK